MRLVFLTFFLFAFLHFTASGEETNWTEKKLGKVIVKADKAARKQRWPRAIKYGEQMLLGSAALDQKNDARYINLLKNLNQYYDQAKRLGTVALRVKEAYILSKEYLSSNHETTRISRNLYYKYLVSQKSYSTALPLVLENISLMGKTRDEEIKKLHYLKQLYSLYRLTGQLEKEEKALLHFLKLDKRIFESSDNDNIKIIINLANNYCQQKKFDEFNTLMKTYNLKYEC
ncbi:MAG: hypothetical protein JKY45_01440 [Emcibacter sp.]|nr:hypothetical protein [Emcibacter sp.]